MTRPDPIEIMTRRVAVGLVRAGMSVEQAAVEADEAVLVILKEMADLGCHDVYIGVLLRQCRVYHLCHRQGLTKPAVAERLGVSIATVKRAYKAEMLRIRHAA